MASVSIDDVRDVINVGSDQVPDAKVLKMIKLAEVTVGTCQRFTASNTT